MSEAINIIYDIFCDASVGPDGRGCCSGMLIERRPFEQKIFGETVFGGPSKTFLYTIQPTGTNNSGEAAAVAMGVMAATDIARNLRESRSGIEYIPWFNVFSDSLITIKGVRDWMPGWIKHIDAKGDLRNSTGAYTANQDFFKYIFNCISTNDVNINFFHQDGHVTHDVGRIIPNFIKYNKGIHPNDIGLTCMQLCAANDFVDNETRSLINYFLSVPDSDIYFADKLSVNHLKNRYLDPSNLSIYMERVKYKLPPR